MARKYQFNDIEEWGKYVNDLLRKRDLDNLVLFAGDPGNGKSTLMLQIAKMLDPKFSHGRIHFSVGELIKDARSLPPFSCVAADELLISRRHHSTNDNKDLLDFLQVGRALNLHILICFPHAGMLDRAVLDRRVRYKIEVPSQGYANIFEREFRTVRDYSGREDYIVAWRKVMPTLIFYPNSGQFWEEYLVKKLNAARKREAEAKGFEDENEEIDAMEAEGEVVRKGHKRIRDGIGGRRPKLVPKPREDGQHHELCGKLFPCPTGQHS